MNDFWSLVVSSYGKKEIWFVGVSANSYSILEQLGPQSRASYMRGEKNEFAS